MVGDRPFDPIWRCRRDPVESDLLGVPVRICSLGRLREMKAAQGRPQDEADLENLPPS